MFQGLFSFSEKRKLFTCNNMYNIERVCQKWFANFFLENATVIFL